MPIVSCSTELLHLIMVTTETLLSAYAHIEHVLKTRSEQHAWWFDIDRVCLLTLCFGVFHSRPFKIIIRNWGVLATEMTERERTLSKRAVNKAILDYSFVRKIIAGADQRFSLLIRCEWAGMLLIWQSCFFNRCSRLNEESFIFITFLCYAQWADIANASITATRSNRLPNTTKEAYLNSVQTALTEQYEHDLNSEYHLECYQS